MSSTAGSGASVRFSLHGVTIAVTSDDSATLDAALPFLPPRRALLPPGRAAHLFHLATAPQANGSDVFTLHAGGARVAAAVNMQRVLCALEWRVTLALAADARDRIFVHAGVVEWRGRAIVVPGRSFSGKSTLVTELLRAGCAYLSDEFAVLDSTGACHAYPRRLSLRRQGGNEHRTAEELGGCTRHEPLRVGCVLVTEYRQGADWRPSRLSEGEGAMALLQHTVAARARSREALAALRAAVAGTVVFEGPRGDASGLVQSLLSTHLSGWCAAEDLTPCAGQAPRGQ